MNNYTLKQIKACRKKATNIWILIYYELASYVTYLAMKLRLAPSAISLVAFLINILSFLFFITRQPILKIDIFLFYIMLNIAHVFDCVDGQLAKLTNKCSVSGEWLDHGLDAFKFIFVGSALMYLILSFDLVDKTSDRQICLIGICAFGAPFLNYFLSMLADKMRLPLDPYNKGGNTIKSTKLAQIANSSSSYIGEYGNYLLIFLTFLISFQFGLAIFLLYSLLLFIFGFLRTVKIYLEFVNTMDNKFK